MVLCPTPSLNMNTRGNAQQNEGTSTPQAHGVALQSQLNG